jgi:putative membrane protein
MSIKNVMRVLAGTAGVLLVAGAAGPGAAAVGTEDSGDVQATVRKTVRQAATATGEITNSTMYTQLSAVGSGTKTVTVPVGSTSNRNLNQFGAFPMEGESMVVTLNVADGGGTEERTVTDADIAPMAVSVKVMLDGVEIAPEDVVGASGVLDVEYTVRNTTARTESVTFSDVEGTEITEDVEVADPFVGSLDVVLPQGFNEVTAPGATVAGNGQNQTQLGYTFVLFPPLGSTEVKVGYQSRISNGQMPEAEFSFLPIVPFDNSTIAGTVEAYRGGAETGATIFGAGDQIGENLLKLQEGAGQLVAGLGQLSAGASQLSDGLVNTAAPGSAALADGANQVADGLNELNSNVPALEEGVSDLNDGAQQLNSGAEQVADGNASLAEGADELAANVPALVDGVNRLNAGAKLVADGLLTLESSLKDLPATVKATDDYKRLVGAIGLIQGQIGSPTDSGTDTALGALNTIGGLMTGVNTGSGKTVVESLGALAGANTCTTMPTADCTDIIKALDAMTDPAAPTAPKPGDVLYATGATAQIAAGLSKKLYNADTSGCTESPPVDCGAYQALEGIKQGIGTLVDSIAAAVYDSDDFKALVAGGQAVSAGLDDLASKTPTLAAGVNQLAAGANQLADGSAQVAAGTDALAEGTETLNGKVPTLASGVEQLDAGAGQVADGADQLAAGLGAAADGSGQLADGLAQAEPGGAQIEDGAGRLKEEGADELAKSGQEAQLGFARNVALLEAAQQAGLEGAGIPFGPAEGTDVVTTAAYKMYVAGIAPEDDNNALKYGLGALLIAGAGGAALAASRKVAS